MPIDPPFEAIITMMPAAPALADLPLDALRNMQASVNPSPTRVDEVTSRMIPGPAGDLAVRIHRSGRGSALPLLVFLHGGGFVVGNLGVLDEMLRILTAETGRVTLAVDYRLAPEHPFPAAPDDCFPAPQWAGAHARSLGADPGSIAVIDESWRGNLAAVTALRPRDEGGPRLTGQVLIYPLIDLSGPFPPTSDGEYYIVTPKDMNFFNRSYVPDAALASHPYASPVRADLHGLPPALVITAEYDPLCEQGEAFAEQLKEACE